VAEHNTAILLVQLLQAQVRTQRQKSGGEESAEVENETQRAQDCREATKTQSEADPSGENQVIKATVVKR
jgi:hypothetical protein